MIEKSPTEGKAANAGGRPLKYKTVAELDLEIQLYFDKQDPHIEEHMVATGVSANDETMFERRKVLTEQKPYTMSGLARALGLSRQSLLNYAERDQFLDSIEGAKQRCEEYAESQLFGPYANGAKFNLINNYKGKHQEWSDRQVLSGDPEAPLTSPYAQLDAATLRSLAGTTDEVPLESNAEARDATDTPPGQA